MTGIEVKLKQKNIYISNEMYEKVKMNMNKELINHNYKQNEYKKIDELALHLKNVKTLEDFDRPSFLWSNSGLSMEQSLVCKKLLYNEKGLTYISHNYLLKLHPSNYPFIGSTKIVRAPYFVEDPPKYNTLVKKIVFTDLFNSYVPISVISGTDNNLEWSPIGIHKSGWNTYDPENTYIEISASENVVFFKEHFSVSCRNEIKDLESLINSAALYENTNTRTANIKLLSEEDCFNKLLQLKHLFDKGVVSQDEYIQKKQELLKQL